MAGGTTIVDRLNKLSGKDATTIAKALQNLEEGGGIGGFEIHICASGEYDAETKVPTITKPDTSTLYLVPTSSRSKNMFDEYVYTGTDWEKFGTGSVALPSVTSADNGKVLGVKNGEYALTQVESVEVEKIKLGTFSGGGGAIASSNIYSFAGGGLLENSKTLEELVGNKTIIGIEFEVPNPDTGREAFIGEAYAGNSSAVYTSLPRLERNLYNEVISLSVYGFAFGENKSSVSVYAICI